MVKIHNWWTANIAKHAVYNAKGGGIADLPLLVRWDYSSHDITYPLILSV